MDEEVTYERGDVVPNMLGLWAGLEIRNWFYLGAMKDPLPPAIIECMSYRSLMKALKDGKIWYARRRPDGSK